MYQLTRATITLVAAATAGVLVWSATRFGDHVSDYWTRVALLAGAGFVIALPRLVGRGRGRLPRLSISVLLIAFVPAAVASLWVIVAGEPGVGSLHEHVLSWTRRAHITRPVDDLLSYISVLAFGTGLVFGYVFEARSPRVREEAPPVVEPDLVEAPPPPLSEPIADTWDDPIVVEPTAKKERVETPPVSSEPSEAASIRDRIGAYTLSRQEDQKRGERRSSRDRRSGVDRRQFQIEPLEVFSERRKTAERRSGIERRRSAAAELSGGPAARHP